MQDKGINDKRSKEKFDNQVNILNKTLIDVLLDLCDREHTDILATLTSKILKRGDKLTVSNHCVAPTGEVL